MDLLGRPAPNTVHIQGKVLSAAEAEPVIRQFGLEPVYVLTNRQMGAPAAPASGSASVTDTLMKQLGVTDVRGIPDGTYTVSVPGPNGALQDATVEVDNFEGGRRVRVKMNNPNIPIR
jgi:hypothetical protein